MDSKGKTSSKSTSTPTNENSDLLPWVEKYRPSTLDEVTGHEDVIATVRKFISCKRVPHMLFYGPPGTGKTTTILAIARELYGAKNMRNMVLELNASDDRGIDVVRNQIKTFASTKQMFSAGPNGTSDNQQNFKLVILDEADAMTNPAQNALRRIIEKYTVHTRFCIIANYAHKINPALLSRCTRFRFSPLSQAAIERRLALVIEAEHVNIEPDALQALLKLSKGDMRKALNVLQPCQSAVTNSPSDETTTTAADSTTPAITQEMIYECVGSPQPGDIQAIVDMILKEDWTTAVRSITLLKTSKGLALADILEGITTEFEGYDLIAPARIHMLEGLSEIEFRLAGGGNEKIHTSATIGVVKGALDIQGTVH